MTRFHTKPRSTDSITLFLKLHNHLESGFHKRLANSIIRKYFVTNPKPNKIDDTIRKCLRSLYKKYEQFQVKLSVRLLIPSNQNKIIRRQHPCHRDQQCINNAFFFSKTKTIREQPFSQILELRITFVCRFEKIRFKYNLTTPKSTLERKLFAMSDNNPEIVHSFNYKRYNRPLFREFFDIYLDDFVKVNEYNKYYRL